MSFDSLTIIENLSSLNLYNCSAKTTLNVPINDINTLLKPHIAENNLSGDVSDDVNLHN